MNASRTGALEPEPEPPDPVHADSNGAAAPAMPMDANNFRVSRRFSIATACLHRSDVRAEWGEWGRRDAYPRPRPVRLARPSDTSDHADDSGSINPKCWMSGSSTRV